MDREGSAFAYLRADIDYSFATAKTIYGILGVKVWVFREKLFRTEPARPGAAQRVVAALSNADASNLKTAQMKNDELSQLSPRRTKFRKQQHGCKVWPPKVATSTLVSLVSKLRSQPGLPPVN